MSLLRGLPWFRKLFQDVSMLCHFKGYNLDLRRSIFEEAIRVVGAEVETNGFPLTLLRSEAGIDYASSQLAMRLLWEMQVVEGEKKKKKRRNSEPRHIIFVLGLPRSGTTRVHNLLKQAINKEAFTVTGELIERFQWPVEGSTDATIHRHGNDIPEEDCQFLQLIMWAPWIPNKLMLHHGQEKGVKEDALLWDQWIKTVPGTTLMAFHQRFYRFSCPPSQSMWICKDPVYTQYLSDICMCYPNAHIVWCHRQLDRLICSNLTINTNGPVPLTPDQILSPLIGSLTAGLRARQALEKSIVDIYYDQVSAQPWKAIQVVLDRFSVSYPADQAEEACRAWLQANPRPTNAGLGQIESFGIHHNDIAAAFQSYITGYPRIAPHTKTTLELCHYCQKQYPTVFVCSKCRSAQYCSSKCQVAAWKSGHKSLCTDTNHHNLQTISQ